MSVLIVLGALALLIVAAYRGFSVILIAPVAAALAILLTDPAQVAPTFTGLFLEAMAGFMKTYFPVFMLGAIFGKLMELSCLSTAIARLIAGMVGRRRAILAVVLMCAAMTYGGISVFVVVFTAYPLAAALFREADIPKRLIPGSMALGTFTFAMDAFPGSPQIQNIIPTPFFGTTAWAAPTLGVIGGCLVAAAGLAYLEWRRRSAGDEGYGTGHLNEPIAEAEGRPSNGFVALLPLLVVFVVNALLTWAIPAYFGRTAAFLSAAAKPPAPLAVASMTGVWAVEGALVLGCLLTIVMGFRTIAPRFNDGTKIAIGGAMLASVNTASEFGFGAVMAALPGFALIRNAMASVSDPLVNEAVTITTLSGVTGSGSGGMGIALAAMGDRFLANGAAAGIPPAVLHRVATMASGGMDTLPHNGAVITLLAVCGLTHRQSYKDIFALTGIKTAAVFAVIAIYYTTHFV